MLSACSSRRGGPLALGVNGPGLSSSSIPTGWERGLLDFRHEGCGIVWPKAVEGNVGLCRSIGWAEVLECRVVIIILDFVVLRKTAHTLFCLVGARARTPVALRADDAGEARSSHWLCVPADRR